MVWFSVFSFLVNFHFSVKTLAPSAYNMSVQNACRSPACKEEEHENKMSYKAVITLTFEYYNPWVSLESLLNIVPCFTLSKMFFNTGHCYRTPFVKHISFQSLYRKTSCSPIRATSPAIKMNHRIDKTRPRGSAVLRWILYLWQKFVWMYRFV